MERTEAGGAWMNRSEGSSEQWRGRRDEDGFRGLREMLGNQCSPGAGAVWVQRIEGGVRWMEMTEGGAVWMGKT